MGMDGDAFAIWTAEFLVPTLVAGDTVVMDNRSVHKNAMARAVM